MFSTLKIKDIPKKRFDDYDRKYHKPDLWTSHFPTRSVFQKITLPELADTGLRLVPKSTRNSIRYFSH
jgi:hypothetical protein